MKSIGMKGLFVFVFCAVLMSAMIAGATEILIYKDSLGKLPRYPVNEKSIAEAMGWNVHIASQQEWMTLTAADFASFDAIIFADDGCEGDEYMLNGAINKSKNVWSPVVTGNVVMLAMDPVYHYNQGEDPTAIEIVFNALNYVVAGDGTGLYVALSCYVEGGPVHVPFLTQFGTFTVDDTEADTITRTNAGLSHPVTKSTTNLELSDWGDTSHSRFLEYPSWLKALALGRDEGNPKKPIVLAGNRP